MMAKEDRLKVFHRRLKRAIRDRRVLFGTAYAIVALVMIYVMTSSGMGVSFDSERYLATAHNLKQGKVVEAFGRIFPHAPMLYPLSIAMIPSVGSDRGLAAARLISIISFVVSVVAIFFVGLEIQGEFTAHLSAISLVFFAPVLYTFSYCWSETMYIMLSLLFLLALTRYVQAGRGADVKYLIACAVFAGAAFLARFIGFSLVATGALAILFLSRIDRTADRIRRLVILLLISVVPILVNLLMAHSYLGTAARESIPSPYSVLDQLLLFFAAVYRDFFTTNLAFDNYVFFFPEMVDKGRLGSPIFWLGTIILCSLLVFGFLLAKLLFSSHSFRRSLRPQKLVISYIVLYGLLLIVITSVTRLDPMGSRFTSPLYPFLLLIAVSLVFRIQSELSPRKISGLLLAVAVLSTSSFWCIQFLSAASIYQGTRSGSFPAMEQPGNRNRPSLKFLQQSLEANDIIVTNVRSKLFFIWPREVPYLGGPGAELSPYLDGLMRESRRRSASVYVLICTRDYSQYAINDIEEINQGTGFFPRKWTFGNDVVYKADFSAAAENSRKGK